jgi:ABC-type transport system substrate-binding protein
MRSKTLVLALLFLAVTQIMPSASAQTSEINGPRVDEFLIKIYPNYNDAVNALEANETDFLAPSLNTSLIDKYSGSPWNANITLSTLSELAMFEIDINNNKTLPAYPNWLSPTYYKAFRHALAHLVDKEQYVSEILGGYGTVLNTPIMPWLTDWHSNQADPHSYNTTQTAKTFDAGGFVDADGDGVREYPSEHIKAGENLDPLIFYTTNEDPARLTVAQLLTSEMQAMGIPINLTTTTWSNIFNQVYIEKNFHLYTGKQDLYNSDVTSNTTVTTFGNLYHSDMYWSYGPNYVHFNNTDFDNQTDTLRYASNQTIAVASSKEAQNILAEQVGIIPLFATVGYKAYRSQWTDIVNEQGNGVDNWWTFVLTHQKNTTGGTLRYGIVGDPGGVNPLWLGFHPLMSFASLIYDPLLRVRDLETLVPSVAKGWEEETWLNPDTGENSTKITFYLNEQVYFHDGVQLTSADVNFTIQYLKTYRVGMNYPKVMNIHHVETPSPYKVIVYTNVTNIWNLYWVGSIPILPKHKWQTITDPSAPTPEPTVTGSGPFKFVEYVPGSHILLEANHNYSWHDVAITEIATPPNLSAGQQNLINVTVENQGIYNETVTVSLYYMRFSDPLIGTQNITLAAGANATLTFEWTPNIGGGYEIRAVASIDTGEVDIADNTCVTTVYVKAGVAKYDGNWNSESNSPILNLVGFLFGVLSVILIVPELSRKRRIPFCIQNTLPASESLTSTRENIWLEQAKRHLI